MKRNVFIFLLLTIMIVTVFFYTISYFHDKKIAAESATHKIPPIQLNLEGQPYIGDKDAPVTIVEFFDLKCPPCWQWENTILPILKNKYIETHKAKIVFINKPLKQHGDDAYLGALALESAYKQNKSAFVPLSEQLFKHQQSPQNTWITNDIIISSARKVDGIDVARLIDDIHSAEIKEEVERDLEIAKTAGVEGTPTLFINNVRVESVIKTENGKQISSNPFNLVKIEEMINQELTKVKK